MWSFLKKFKTEKPFWVERSIDKFVRVKEINFFGQFSESKNKKFLVAWSDSDPLSRCGGFRDSGYGTYILAEENRVLLVGSAERPNDGKVADNGTFLINDWMFGEGLKGELLAFNKNGVQILKHKFSANLYKNGISDTGRFAICQLCNSDSSDSGVLALFDLHTQKLLWKKIPETGWADSYEFNCDDQIIHLCYNNRGKFAYHIDGSFIDGNRWEAAIIEFASGFELHQLAKNKISELELNRFGAEAEEIIQILEKALNRDLQQYPNEQASIYRTMGEFYEIQSEISKALQLYEKALQLNPKVGLKRKVAALKSARV